MPMMYSNKKIIELVKEYRILYDSNHPDYKNIAKKEKAWKEIGAALDQDFYTVKKKWKNIKDSYAKHLKSKTLTTPNAHRYKHWPWARQMEQFRPFLPFTSTSTTSKETTKLNGEDCETNSNSSSEAVIKTFEETTPKSICSTTLKRKRSASNINRTLLATNKILDHLKNNRNFNDYDATELIFLGYAKTIKKFSLERQANIKLEIAQIIMRYEIDNEKDEMIIGGNSDSPNSTEFINAKIETL